LQNSIEKLVCSDSFIIFTKIQQIMMMNLKSHIFLTAIFAIFTFHCSAQRYLEKANTYFEREQFKLAIDNYQKQYDRSEKSRNLRAEISYKLAQCYMKLSEPQNAIPHYKNAVDFNYRNKDLYFELSEAYLQYEEFESAISILEEYQKLKPEDPRTVKAIERIHQTLEMIENPTRYKVEIFGLINSGELDFCPFFGYKDYDKMYFTSSRSVLDNPDINLESGELFTDIYMIERERGSDAWSVPEKIQGSVNSDFDEGAASLNRRFNVLYFNRCEYDPKKDVGCRIYTAKKRSFYWVESFELPIPGIPENISIGHPAISEDELTLYFVADSMLGGYGGKDIYKVTRERKSMDFGAPQNLGPDINSDKDDCFPYLRDDGTLFFASESHGSMGGLDIFRAVQLGPSTYNVTNLGSPINSPADDYGIVFMGDAEEGYFTSHRRGGVGKSDIYHFSLDGDVFDISGIVWDKQANQSLKDVEVSLCDQEGNVLDTIKTNAQGKYSFQLKKNQIYQLYFAKKPYVTVSERVSTKDEKLVRRLTRDVFMQVY
jgi:peptidoglycan-associated lipoprotein